MCVCASLNLHFTAILLTKAPGFIGQDEGKITTYILPPANEAGGKVLFLTLLFVCSQGEELA